MWNRTLPLLALFPLFATSQAAEQSRLRVVEQAIETSSAEIRLPDQTPATLFARSCPKCEQRSLQVSAQTKFFLGRIAVSQNEFNVAAQQSTRTLGIFFDSNTEEVTRLVAFGAKANAATRPSSRGSK